VLASSVVDIGIVCALAVAGVVMEPLPWPVLLGVLLAAAGFTLVLDQVKMSVLSRLRID